jgi:hypothetical protein
MVIASLQVALQILPEVTEENNGRTSVNDTRSSGRHSYRT